MKNGHCNSRVLHYHRHGAGFYVKCQKKTETVSNLKKSCSELNNKNGILLDALLHVCREAATQQ